MIIAIDYDNTYAADPETFDQVIKVFQAAGHTVICVTGRTAGVAAEPVYASIGKLIPVILAGKDWKREAAEKRGYSVDVWIDDTPEMIAKQHLIGGWAR